MISIFSYSYRQIYVKRYCILFSVDIHHDVTLQARWRNNYCCGKQLNTILALVTQHAKRMRHIAICGMSGCIMFSHILTNGTTFWLGGNDTEHKMCFYLLHNFRLQHISFQTNWAIRLGCCSLPMKLTNIHKPFSKWLYNWLYRSYVFAIHLWCCTPPVKLSIYISLSPNDYTIGFISPTCFGCKPQPFSGSYKCCQYTHRTSITERTALISIWDLQCTKLCREILLSDVCVLRFTQFYCIMFVAILKDFKNNCAFMGDISMNKTFTIYIR